MSDNEIRAEEGDWVADFAENNKDNQNQNQNPKYIKMEYMKFDKPGKYTIRLVGGKDEQDATTGKVHHKMGAVKFSKYYKPFDKIARLEKVYRIITHKSYKDEDPAWNAGWWPNDTYAIHMIDRADGKLKILEKGKTLFKGFADYQSVNEKNPAGKDAPDFVVDVVWPKGNKNAAEYRATAKSSPSPLTDGEKKLIKDSFTPADLELANKAKEMPLTWRLKAIYKTTPLSKIKELWEKIPENDRIPPKREKKEYGETKTEVQPKIEESVPATEESDDLFEGGDNNKEIPF